MTIYHLTPQTKTTEEWRISPQFCLAIFAAVVKKRSKRRLISFTKANAKLQKGFRAILDKIKRLRLRIRVKGLDRLRRQCRCFAVPKLPVPPRRKDHRYHKLASVKSSEQG